MPEKMQIEIAPQARRAKEITSITFERHRKMDGTEESDFWPAPDWFDDDKKETWAQFLECLPPELRINRFWMSFTLFVDNWVTYARLSAKGEPIKPAFVSSLIQQMYKLGLSPRDVVDLKDV